MQRIGLVSGPVRSVGSIPEFRLEAAIALGRMAYLVPSHRSRKINTHSTKLSLQLLFVEHCPRNLQQKQPYLVRGT